MAMRVGGFRVVVLAALLSGGAALPRAAFAVPERKNVVEKLAEDAAAAYKAGEYQRAVDLLERAYSSQPLTALLYNLAKAYDKLGKIDKARTLYQKYAVAEDADPKLRARAEQRVAALGGRGEPRPKEPSSTGTGEPTRPPPGEPNGTARTPPPQPPPSSAGTTDTVLITPTTFEPPPEDPMVVERRRRWRDRGLAITFGVVGVAAIGAAIGMSVSALDLQHQFERSLDENRKRALRDDAQTHALVADVLYPVGAVALAVGAVFLWRGLRPVSPKRADHASVLVVPTLATGGGGLVVGGSF